MQTQVLEQDHNTVTESAILSKQIQIAKSPNSTRSNLSDNYDYWHGENGFYIEYNENNEAIIYPESDGQPMAENTKQYDFLTDIVGNLRIMTADDPNILVVGDLLWYPVQGQTGKGNVYTPDVMVVIGRPKGHRGSYLQWLENDIAPQIVFEIWSISNTAQHKREKFNFYQKHGVQEYYTIDSETDIWEGWIRDQDMLEKIEDMDGWRSPRLGFQFKCESKEMKLLYPGGRPFLNYVDFDKQRQSDAKIIAESNRLSEEKDDQISLLQEQIRLLQAQLQEQSKS